MDEFEFTFSDKVALERRADSLEDRIELYEDRITKYQRNCNPRPWQIAAIERFEDRIDVFQDELDFINDELTNYAGVETQAEDAWDINAELVELSNGVDYGKATITVEDSLFDATYEEGDDISVRATATKTKKNGATKRWSSNFTVIDGASDNGITTFTFGGSNLGTMLDKYDTVSVSIFDEFGDTIYSQIV